MRAARQTRSMARARGPAAWVPAVLGFAVVAGAGLLAFAAATAPPSPAPPPPDRAALLAYTQALRSPTADGGRLVEQDMKPAVADFQAGRLDGPGLARRAAPWPASLRAVQARIAAVRGPAAVAGAAPLFNRALDGYVEAAGDFEAAGRAADPAEAAARLRAGIAAAEVADATYDRAAGIIQRALAAAGLPADHDLPAGS